VVGLIYSLNLASSSTRASSSLEQTLLTLQTLKLPLKVLDPARSTLMPSAISQPLQTSLMLDSGVATSIKSHMPLPPPRACYQWQLLKPGTPNYWNNEINEPFGESKATIIRDIEESVHIFDKCKPT